MTAEKQYNAIPEGFEGEQKRRTDFSSPEEKLAYDAENLITMAQQISKERGFSVTPESLTTRADDNIDALRRAIAIKLKTKPDFEVFVDKLPLSDDAREKLKAMMTVEEYNSAAETYYEMGGTKVPPTRDQIMVEIMT